MGISLQSPILDRGLRSTISLQVTRFDPSGELVPNDARLLLFGGQFVFEIGLIVVDLFELFDKEKLSGMGFVAVGKKFSSLHVLPLQGCAAANKVWSGVIGKPDFSLSSNRTVDDVFSLLLGRLGNNCNLAFSQAR